MLRVQSILGLADDDVDDLMKLGELNNTKIGEFIRDFMNKDIRNVNAAVFQCTDDWFMAMEEDQSKGYLYSEIAFCLITNFEAYDVNIDERDEKFLKSLSELEDHEQEEAIMGMPSKEVLWRLEDLFKKLMSKIKSETQKICDIIDNEVEIAKHDLEDVNYYRGARDIAERTKAFIKRGCRT